MESNFAYGQRVHGPIGRSDVQSTILAIFADRHKNILLSTVRPLFGAGYTLCRLHWWEVDLYDTVILCVKSIHAGVSRDPKHKCSVVQLFRLAYNAMNMHPHCGSWRRSTVVVVVCLHHHHKYNMYVVSRNPSLVPQHATGGRLNHKGHFVRVRAVGEYYNILLAYRYRHRTLGIYFNVCKSCQPASARSRARPQNENKKMIAESFIRYECNVELKTNRRRSFGLGVCVCLWIVECCTAAAMSGCRPREQQKQNRKSFAFYYTITFTS